MEKNTRVSRRNLRYLVERKLRATLALLLFLDFAFAGNAASCIASTGVREGEAASVICNYHKNLREEKTGFYVYRYPFDGKDPETPVVCAWDIESLICDAEPGYQTKLQNKSVTLTIPSALQNHAGTYSCKTFQSSEDQPVKNCSLTVQGQFDDFPQKSEIYNNETVYCQKKTHLLQGQPKSVVCFVHRSFNARSIVLERQEFQGPSEPEEIARCDKRTECRLNVFGYEINSKKDDGFTVIIAMAYKAGRYVCTAEGENQKTETCSLSVDAAPRNERLSDKPTEKWFEPIHLIAIVLLCTNIISFVAVLFLSFRYKRRGPRHHQETDEGENIELRQTSSNAASDRLNPQNMSDG